MIRFVKNIQERREKEFSHELREKIIFKLLADNKIDLYEFVNSPIYDNPNNYYLIEHIYGLLNGYIYRIVIKYDESSQSLLTVEEHDPSNYTFNFAKMRITFDNDKLTIINNNDTYTYEVNEHCRYFFNGEELKLGRIVNNRIENAIDKTKKMVKKIWVNNKS